MQRQINTLPNRWDMEIKSLKVWNAMCLIALPVFYCFIFFPPQSHVCTERKLKGKEQQLKGFILSAERKVEIEPCCWETNPLSSFPFWCIGLPHYMNCWRTGPLWRLCCSLGVMFCKTMTIFNRQATIRPLDALFSWIQHAHLDNSKKINVKEVSH